MGEQPRILLVDDEPDVLKLVGKRLEVEGLAVETAADGQEALRKARAAPFDLIILDLMLPKLNGYEVCAMLKQDARYRHIPIVMFSAKAQDKDARLGLECGADLYLTKPFVAQDLLAQVRGLLQRSATGSQTGGAHATGHDSDY